MTISHLALMNKQHLGKVNVSGVVLTLNEEGRIARCLESLSWCDQVHVVDSGSSDQTKEIARRLGAKVHVHKQEGAFFIAKQRNWSLRNLDIDSDWVLFVDADEVIGANCRDEVIRRISSTESRIEAYDMAPRYWFLGKWIKHTQGYPSWHPRLVKKACVEFEGEVWESFPERIKKGKILEPYEHYAFCKGIDDWLKRHIRYAEYEAHRIIDYLDSSNSAEFKTNRMLFLRVLSAKLWTMRPATRFIHKYLFNKGFLDGWQGFVYALLMAVYEFITVIKIIQIKRQSRGLSL